MNAFGITDKGKVRSANQDAYRLSLSPDGEYVLAALCDGMGGVHGGEIASAVAADSFMQYAEDMLRREPKSDAAQVLREAAAYANLKVYDRAFRDESCRGMGTTLVAALVRPEDAAVVNIGDSRCYWLADGQLQQVTRDHSLVQSMVDRGLITEDEARSHPRKNVIMRAVGLERTIRSDIFRLDIRPGDALLLCSDGLSNLVDAGEMESLLLASSDDDAVCRELLRMALDRGAPDNVTLALVRRWNLRGNDMDTKNQDKYRGMMLDGRYELVELIGSGGMAVVYKAMCHRLNRYVAVKIMRPELAKNEKFRRRFQTESQAIAKLSHPNIVGVYDVSRTDHVEYIVMELVDGITLKQYLQDHGPLDAVQAVDFSLQIARALAHAHGKGIVHRDIKPQNILVVNDGVIKVADFGIANLQSEVPDVENEAIGSVHYISPEQARGLPVDGRSDIYSLGIVMYEMLSGKLPFDGDDDRTVALKHLSAVPTPLREIAPSVPEALEKIVMKAMEASLDNRYQTADALAADLEALQKSFTGSLDRIEGNVAPLSTAGELGREDYVRRRRRAHRVSMLSGFFGVMAAILIIAVFLWNYFLSDIFVVNQRVAIPNFVGSNYETIINSKEFKGKYNFDLIYEIDPNVERGIIIGQSPDAGKSYMLTSDGIHVTLTVSTGVMLTEIPNLLNYDYREATSELEKLGFVVDKTFADSDDVAADCVMQISPSPGEKLPAGATVYLTISQGAKTETVIMPYLVGKDYATAEAELAAARLTLVSVSYVYNNTIPVDYVVSQTVEAGTEIPAYSKIYLQISLGPETTPTPSPSPVPTQDPNAE